MDELTRKTIEILRARIAEQEAQIELMRTIIKEIPGVIVQARLDAKAGKETTYDYARAGKALASILK